MSVSIFMVKGHWRAMLFWSGISSLLTLIINLSNHLTRLRITPAVSSFFNTVSYDAALIDELIAQDVRVVYISDEVITHLEHVLNAEVLKISRPFSGRQFYEVLDRRHNAASLSGHGVAKVSVHYQGDVLVAEDNPVNSELMETVLTVLGVKVTMVHTGSEAYDLAKTNAYDLIFIDVNMPDMDGIATSGKIREYEIENQKPKVPIVILTANTDDEIKDRLNEGDFDGYVTKPFKKNADIELYLEKISAKARGQRCI